MDPDVFDELYDRVCDLYGNDLINFTSKPSPLETQRDDVTCLTVISRQNGERFYQMFNVKDELGMSGVDDVMKALKAELQNKTSASKLDPARPRV